MIQVSFHESYILDRNSEASIVEHLFPVLEWVDYRNHVQNKTKMVIFLNVIIYKSLCTSAVDYSCLVKAN